MAQAMKQARQHVREHLRECMMTITEMLSVAKLTIVAPEYDGGDAEALCRDSDSLSTAPSKLMHPLMEDLDNAVQVYRSIFILFDAIQPNYPLLYAALGAKQVRADACDLLGQVLEQLDMDIHWRVQERQCISHQLQRAQYLRRLDAFVFPTGTLCTFYSVYITNRDRGTEISHAAHQELIDNIRRHAFGGVSVDRISSIASPDMRSKIAHILEETFDDFCGAIDTTLQLLESSLDEKRASRRPLSVFRSSTCSSLSAKVSWSPST
jgi:hypothetical protein